MFKSELESKFKTEFESSSSGGRAEEEAQAEADSNALIWAQQPSNWQMHNELTVVVVVFVVVVVANLPTKGAV